MTRHEIHPNPGVKKITDTELGAELVRRRVRGAIYMRISGYGVPDEVDKLYISPPSEVPPEEVELFIGDLEAYLSAHPNVRVVEEEPEDQGENDGSRRFVYEDDGLIGAITIYPSPEDVRRVVEKETKDYLNAVLEEPLVIW